MQLIDGKSLANKVQSTVTAEVEKLTSKKKTLFQDSQ